MILLDLLLDFIAKPERALSQSIIMVDYVKYMLGIVMCTLVYVKVRRKIDHNVKEFYPPMRLDINGNLRG